jgi:hypothetical protein
MTPVHVHGQTSHILTEAGRSLYTVSRPGLLLILLGWLSLAFATDRWFLLVGALLPSPLVVASTFWLLMLGAITLLNASYLLLESGVTIPARPSVTNRARRLLRVGAVELVIATAAAALLALIDGLMASALARWAANNLIWRDLFLGIPSPGPAWLLAWACYCLCHTAALSWLWPAVAANYPGGTLRATLTLASRAGRRTPWLAHATVGTSLMGVAIALLRHEVSLLAIVALMVWPAIANTAAARLQAS